MTCLGVFAFANHYCPPMHIDPMPALEVAMSSSTLRLIRASSRAGLPDRQGKNILQPHLWGPVKKPRTLTQTGGCSLSTKNALSGDPIIWAETICRTMKID